MPRDGPDHPGRVDDGANLWREGDVIDSIGTAHQPVRLGARTWRGVLAQAGVIAAGACIVALIFAIAFGWSEWALALALVFFVATWLLVLSMGTEWTVADHELLRRRWLSRPGTKPSVVMALGPQVGLIRQSRLMWHVVPSGPSLGGQPWQTDGPTLGGQPWQTRGLVGAMARAGVHVNDWRGDWARRHRRLDSLGLLAYWGGLVGIIVMPALRVEWPGVVTATAGLACAGAVFLGLAVDYLPWNMRRPPTRGS
jgi:hypothetical protein